MSERSKFLNPEYYYNRELSWLKFNYRILSEARDKENPLFERLKFLSITASNLDEFIMVRVASIKDMVIAEYDKKDIAGLTPKQQLAAINAEVHEFVSMQYSTLNRSLLPLLKQQGIVILGHHEELTAKQGEFVDRYFENNVYPVLTPMAVDSSRPFPLIRNKSLNLGALVQKKGEPEADIEFACVQVPSVLPRIIEIPEQKERTFIFLEEIIERNIEQLFLNYDIEAVHPFRIMRDADFDIEEDETEDLLKEIEKQVKKRQWGEAIRLEVEDDMHPKLRKLLQQELSIASEDIFEINGPLDLNVFMKFYGTPGFEHLKEAPHTPQPVPELSGDVDLFAAIREKDILLHHPYQTFAPVVEFVQKAAKDPAVLAIKQTLYRVSGNSPIIAALEEAADHGKQVSVLVELKARFDEENNIIWAKRLEKAGCHVIYGLVGLKTHSKITLVVRKEDDGIRRYVHLGTGNYNDSTAKLYTDMGLLTCKEAIGEDATAVFNMLSGYSEPRSWNKLSVAPLWLKNRFLYLIEREMKYASEGKDASIVAKMNSLCDPEIISALYEASGAGVKIELIVRGICCLKTGVPGVSENITVRSIVGTYLEHSRVFVFENGGNPEYYMASADWMPRNLNRRVELLFPIEQDDLKEKTQHVMDCLLRDNLKAQILQPDGSYERIDRRGKELFGAQKNFCDEADAETALLSEVLEERIFTPCEKPEV